MREPGEDERTGGLYEASTSTKPRRRSSENRRRQGSTARVTRLGYEGEGDDDSMRLLRRVGIPLPHTNAQLA